MNISWPGGCFSVFFLSFFLGFCVLIFFLAVWGLGFSGGGTDWLICCNPDCCWGLRAQFPCQKVAMWGLRIKLKIWVYAIMTIGLVYPFSEHVDIFPVRLCLHSHWVHSVYLTLAFYHCGRNKRQGLDPFIFSIKDSLHIHKWHGTFYYCDTMVCTITIPSSPCRKLW